MTNNTINNSLFLLATALSTPFSLTLQDNLFRPVVNGYISAMRWYPSLNQYKVTDMGKTDDKGQTVVQVKTDDTDYRIGSYDSNGNLLFLFNPIRFVCSSAPCEYSLFLPASGQEYQNVFNIQQRLSFNSTSKVFTFIWNDPSQATQTMNLTVFRDMSYGTSTVCSTTGEGFTGLITCDVSSYTGVLRAEVYRTASPRTILTQLIVNLGQQLSSLAGGKTIGLFMSFILFIFAFIVGMFNPVASIVLGISALIPSLWVGVFGYATFIGIILLGWVTIHWARRT